MSNPRRSAGRGCPPGLDFFDNRLGRGPVKNHVKRDPISNNYKLHVRSVPENWNKEMLTAIFQKCGEPLNVFVSPPKGDGGFTWGFVEYAHFGEAQNAIRFLNDNVLLTLRVSFAKEKPPEEFDPTLAFIIDQQKQESHHHHSAESLVDPRKLVQTVKNKKDVSFSDFPFQITNKPVYDQETMGYIEELLFQKALEKYKKPGASTAKCNTCKTGCTQACSGCFSVFYCSETCQNKDWNLHSQNCGRTKMDGAGDVENQFRGDSNNRQSNGFRSFDNKNNQFSDRRSDNRDNDKISYRDQGPRNNRDDDKGSFRGQSPRINRDDDKGSFRDRGSREYRENGNQQQGRRSILEERKMKMVSSSRQNNDRGFENRFGQNNQRFSNSQENRNSYKPQMNNNDEDEDWGSSNQDPGVKESSDTSPGLDFIKREKAFLHDIESREEIKTEVKKGIAAPTEKETFSAETKEDTSSTPVAPVTTDSPPVAASTTPVQQTLSPSDLPPTLTESQFTTVHVVLLDPNEKDTYYVGGTTFDDCMTTMLSHFKQVVEQCEILVPKCGVKGIASYMDIWYRAEIVSIDPVILAQFIDFGNVEEIQPNGLKRCPEAYVDIPNLVRKIKLAEGTNEKYFNLPDGAEISVKAVSTLADGTIVVQVEDENSPEMSNTSEDLKKQPSPASTPNLEPSPAPAPAPPGRPSVPASGSVEPHLSTLQSTVDLLEEKWKISFMPNTVDYVKKSVMGQVYCENISSTLSFFVENEKFQDYLSAQEFDPKFKPIVGEIVGVRFSSEWERGKVLPTEGIVALNDLSGVICSSRLFKLPEMYTQIPSMAAVLTLRESDQKYLNDLMDMDDIVLNVVKKTRTNGHTVVNVKVEDAPVEGELRAWVYEPLETPDPLTVGDKVTIVNTIDSNTLLVTPAEDMEFQNVFQIQSMKSCEEFQHQPKVGDYVSFYHKESEVYYRCRIDKFEGGKYMIYAVDVAKNHEAKLEELKPLTSCRQAPCRISQIELKDIGKVRQTEQAMAYLDFIETKGIHLTIVDIDDIGKSTLTVDGEEDTLNIKLKALLNPPVVPTSEGKLMIDSLRVEGVPLNQEFQVCVSQTDPLYVQLVTSSVEYITKLYQRMQEYCANVDASYNPCQDELCLALYEGDWYRCRCLRETNRGVSVLMLVDYGNIFETKCSEIRQILPDMVSLPSLGIPCIIHDLPDPVPPALKERVDELLKVDSILNFKFVSQEGDSYVIETETVKQAIQELK